MTYAQRHSPEADPASPEPSTARAEGCSCGGRVPEPDLAEPDLAEDDLAEDDLRVLRRLRDLSMAVAELMVAQIQDEDGECRAARAAAPPGEDPGPPRRSRQPGTILAFQRAERGVIQSIALSGKLRADRQERDRKGAAGEAAVQQQRRERRRKQLHRLVREAIEQAAAANRGIKPLHQANLLETLAERIEEEDVERDLDRCSMGEMVARLCTDLKLTPCWDFWREDHWAREEARLALPGSPYCEPAPVVADTAERDTAPAILAEIDEKIRPQHDAEPAQDDRPAPEVAEPVEAEPPELEPAKAEPADEAVPVEVIPEWLMELRRRIGTAPPRDPPSG